MKFLKIILSSIVLLALGIYLFNFFTLKQPAKAITEDDSRNKGIEYEVNYKYYFLPSVLVFDLKKVPLDKAAADVFRVFLQTARALETKQFEKVEISYNGITKFYLEGHYYLTLGEEFEDQNPVYTIRTFPENLFDADGNKAYPVWEGGMLGVLGKQMKDFNDFTGKWYLEDVLSTRD